MKRKDICWNDYFIYNENSPSSIINSVDRGKKAKVGSTAGHVMRDYYHVRVWNVTYRVHRIIWEMHYGEIPDGMFIDHIDGNTLNNKLSNLRLVDAALSARNRGVYKNNTSSITGVHMYDKDGCCYVCAQFYGLDGKRVRKNFSVLKLGLIPATYAAAKWRSDRILELNNVGAGYTDRHKGLK